jgi:hypothetical protein
MRDPRRNNVPARGEKEEIHTIKRAPVGDAKSPIGLGSAALQTLRYLAQRQLPQGRQIFLGEEMLQRPLDLLLVVDLPRA